MIETLLAPDRVFDGRDTRVGAVVGLDAGRIVYVGPESSAPHARDRHELPGATLAPGLIDMHVHVTPWAMFGFLAAGVTTVRDLANDIDTATELLERVPAHFMPRIHWLGRALDGPEVNWPTISTGHATPAELADSIHAAADRGLRAVKLYANLSGEFIEAAVAVGRERGIRIVSHCGTDRLREAVAAGIDEAQHLAGALARDLGVEPGPSAIEAFLELEVDHCPTLVVWEGMALIGVPRAHRDRGRDWVPPLIEEAWADARHATQPAHERQQRLADLVERLGLVRALHEAGRRIVVGSDAAFIGLAPGFSLHDELGLLVVAGVPAIDAMRAVTSGNADVLGETGEVGCILPGARADLVAFDGDPTVTITDVGRVRQVWSGGRAIDAAELRAAADAEFRTPPDGPPDRLALQRYIPGARH
jgi:imidazolonepropionase-like amidohydrolase